MIGVGLVLGNRQASKWADSRAFKTHCRGSFLLPANFTGQFLQVVDHLIGGGSEEGDG